jgi:hypothetical protein
MLRFLILACGMLAGLTGTYGAERIPVETFARGAEMRSPAISPSGKLLVYVSHIKDKHYVIVRDLVARSDNAILLGEIKEFLVQNCWFKTDERLVCHFLGTAFELGDPYAITRMLAVNTDGSNVKVLVQNGSAGVSQFQDRILHRLPDDPEHVLVQLDADGNIFPAVFKLNIRTGGMSQVVREREPVLHWFADRDGAVRFGYGFTDTTKKGIYMARDSADGDWRVLDRFVRFDSEHWRVAGFSVTKDSLLVLSNHNGRDALFEMDLHDQSDQQLLFSAHTTSTGPRNGQRMAGSLASAMKRIGHNSNCLTRLRVRCSAELMAPCLTESTG